MNDSETFQRALAQAGTGFVREFKEEAQFE
jgi:hypothetical protein